VPRLYLKRWSHDGKKVWTYRLLVSHENVPLWRPQSYASVANHEHLYTRHLAAGEADEIENWLAREFEAPAEPVIEKVISGARMHSEDWRCLARFVAAQDIRTPARMIELIKRWQKTLPDLVQNTLQTSVQKMKEAQEKGEVLAISPNPLIREFPSRVTTHLDPGAEMGTIRLETAPGRAMWLFQMRHLLTKTIAALLEHRWTILRPPTGGRWLTSDNPVIRLNYYGPGNYDFEGGWGREGGEILLPLSPEHMLYTKIGSKARRDTASPQLAQLIQSMTIKHAHRFVFAIERDSVVENLRPRVVDASAFKEEAEFWRRWQEIQGEIERSLLGRS